MSDSLGRLQSPPETRETFSLRDCIDRLRSCVASAQAQRAAAGAYQRLLPPEMPVDSRDLRICVDRLRPAMEKITSARKAVDRAERRIEELQQQIRQFVRQNPKCQACGGDINPETLMSTVPGLHSHSHATVDGEETASGAKR